METTEINRLCLTLSPRVLLHEKKFPCVYMKNQTQILGKNGIWEDHVRVEEANCGVIVRRTFKNVSNQVLSLKELAMRIDGIAFDGESKDDYYYTVENPRLFGNFTLLVDFKRTKGGANEFGLPISNIYVDPDVINERICHSPYMPYPAILISNYASMDGVVIGSLSQECFFHNFTLAHEEGKLVCNLFSSFKAIAYRKVQPGETISDCWYIGVTENADEIEQVFDEYNEELRKVLKDCCGSSDQNRHSLVWDSWNDGIFRDISEEMLFAEAKALKECIPAVEWIQVDDGYSSYCVENVDLDAHGLGVPYEGEDGVDKNKFPNGLKGYTKKIKGLGLRSAIWVGGFCPVKSQIYKEKPEWFIDYTYRCDFSQPLDVSKEEVRAYMCKAMKTLTADSGFEGVKHDFWSYAFEDSHDLLENKDKSGYEYRNWWQNEVRKCVPKGYIQTGCDLAMGNPFLGQYFNNYRFGLDVQDGEWSRIRTTVFWGTAYLSTHTGDLFIPNSDSIGFLPGVSDDEFLLWTTFSLISRSMVEISGRFTQADKNNPRLRVLKKATAYINNGQDVHFVDFDYRQKGETLPSVMYIDTPHFSPNVGNEYLPQKTVALFNFDEEEKEIRFSFDEVGLQEKDYIVTDVWNETSERINNAYVCTLRPHECRLLSLSDDGQFAILDSNTSIANVERMDHYLIADVTANTNVELTLLGELQSVWQNGLPISFEKTGNHVRIEKIKKGKMTLMFVK